MTVEWRHVRSIYIHEGILDVGPESQCASSVYSLLLQRQFVFYAFVLLSVEGLRRSIVLFPVCFSHVFVVGLSHYLPVFLTEHEAKIAGIAVRSSFCG